MLNKMQTLFCLALILVVNAEERPTTSTKNFFGSPSDSSSSRNLTDFFASSQDVSPVNITGRSRNGKDLFDLIGLGTGPEVDPYLSRTNSLCLNGELAECFKSRALSSLEDFFGKEVYNLNEFVRVVRMPESQLRSLSHEPYEYTASVPRTQEPEWDSFVQFLLRKVERFVKSTALEVKVTDEISGEGRYSPRFLDEIASEIDILENKKDTAFSRFKLKKLFIPLLIILKLFKLKLLLFLPMILGLASFKKLLGFLAIVIPGLIGFFKVCKPNSSAFGYGHNEYYSPPKYSPAGIGSGSPTYYSHSVPYNQHYKDSFGDYTGYSAETQASQQGNVAFRDDQNSAASETNGPYQFYEQFRSNKN